MHTYVPTAVPHPASLSRATHPPAPPPPQSTTLNGSFLASQYFKVDCYPSDEGLDALTRRQVYDMQFYRCAAVRGGPRETDCMSDIQTRTSEGQPAIHGSKQARGFDPRGLLVLISLLPPRATTWLGR